MIPKAMTKSLALVLLAVLVLASGCARYMQKLDIGEDEPEPVRAHTSLPDELARVVEAAGGNGGRLRAYLEAYEKETPEARAAARVVAGLCLADAAEYSAGDLETNQELALAARAARPWGGLLPEDVFLDFVLAPRVGREMCSAWRADLTPLLAAESARARTIAQAVDLVRLRVRSWATFAPSRGFVLPPLGAVRAAGGDARDLAVLLACSLRTVGVPARVAGAGTGLVEYWDQGWKALDVLDAAGLAAEALARADGERELRLRHWKGAALAWLASRRDPGCPREAAAAVLTAARGNWQAVADFLSAVPLWRPEAYLAYLEGLDLKRLAVLDAQSALTAVRTVVEGPGVPDPAEKKRAWSAFVRDVLPDRLADEPPSAWREAYVERFLPLALGGASQARSGAQAWAGSLRLTEWPVPGPVLTPMQILRSGRVTGEHERDLARRAALRAVGLE